MIAYVFQKYPKNFWFQQFIILQSFKGESCNLLFIYFKKFLSSFLFIDKTLRLNNLKTRTAMNANILEFISVEVIIHLVLHNLHDCAFNDMLLKVISGHINRTKLIRFSSVEISLT